MCFEYNCPHCGQIMEGSFGESVFCSKCKLFFEMEILHLNLKGKHWDKIKSGDKDFEYRLATKYWLNRISFKTFDAICLKRGYPKKDDKSKMLWKKWNGYEIIYLKHPEFGDDKKRVLKIDVREDL